MRRRRDPRGMKTEDTFELPTRPFRSADIAELGITRHRLRTLLKTGRVRRVLQGVYVDAALDDSVELRAQAIAIVTPANHVVCDRTAAWIHGVDILISSELDVLPPVETCAVGSGKASRRAGVSGHTRDLSPRDVTTVHGVRVTTPLRTALDLGCRLTRKDALAAMDALCRAYAMTRQHLARELKRFRGRRGVVQLKELVALVDPRAESARESWTRLAIHDAGLPAPDLQHWIVVDGEKRYRLDLAYPGRRIAVEYDGFADHRRTKEQIERDVERRQWLHDHGWTVIIIRVGDFSGYAVDRWLDELRHALRPDYTNVRRLERGDRARHIARTSGDGA